MIMRHFGVVYLLIDPKFGIYIPNREREREYQTKSFMFENFFYNYMMVIFRKMCRMEFFMLQTASMHLRPLKVFILLVF